MKRRYRALVILLAAMAAPGWASPAPGGLAAAFGAGSQCSQLTLSSSGRMLAWRQAGTTGVEIVVYDLQAKVIRRTLGIDPGLTVNWLAWEDDDTLLMSALDTERMPHGWNIPAGRALQWSRMLALDVASGHTRVLLADRETTPSRIDSGGDLLAWDIPQRPHTVIMAATVFEEADYHSQTGSLIHNARTDSGLVSAVFAVDTLTGKDEPIAHGDPYTAQWIVDDGGNLVARSEWHPHRYTVDVRQGDQWRQIYQQTEAQEPSIAGLDAKAHALLLLRWDDGGWHLWTLPLDGSSPTRMLPAVSQQAVSVDFDRYEDEPAAVWVGRADEHRIWLSSTDQVRYESVAHAFPGRQVTVYDPSRDGSKVLAEVEATDAPPIYYLIDFTSHHADIAGEAYPQLAHIALATSRVIQYPTSGGRSVRARLILPAGGGKRLPLVVLPPGGPEGDTADFDWFAQYLAAEGYAVLRPDIPRVWLPSLTGSLSWGGVSQDYALAGVQHLVQQGQVDPRRVCIVGVGYGGYAALAAVAFSPGVYACAASINGISDPPALVGELMSVSGGPHSIDTLLSGWRDHLGSPFDPKVIAQAPVHAVDKVVAPVLLIHDEADPIVPLTQALEMQHALQQAGKPVELIKIRGSDHWLQRGRDRIEVLRAIGGFLRAHLH